MAELSIYIVEDEPLYANQLLMLVDELGYQLAGMADNGEKAINEILTLNPDLLLMDIKVKGERSGIEIVASIQEKIKAPVIFITSFTDQETFDNAKVVNPYAFLTKPFDGLTLQRTIELAFNNSQLAKPGTDNEDWKEDVVFQESFFIKTRNKLEKVQVDEILYLEVEDRYSTVFTEGGKKYVLRMSMENVQKKLPQDKFFRTHRKYSVNLSKVKSMDLQDNLLSVGDVSIPISRSSKEELMKKLDWIQ